MATYEYKVVPAPTKGKAAKGVKGVADRYAFALTELFNELAAEGWEYHRADTLPCEHRSGLTSKTTTFQNVLIFRRLSGAGQDQERPVQIIPPTRPKLIAETVAEKATGFPLSEPEPQTDPQPQPRQDPTLSARPQPDDEPVNEDKTGERLDRLVDALRSGRGKKKRSSDPDVAAE